LTSRPSCAACSGEGDAWLRRLVELESDVRYQEWATEDEPEFRHTGGSLPVLLSAPHGAVHTRAGRLKEEDEYTAGLCRLVAELSGAHALYARRKSRTDPNWHRAVPFKRRLAQIAEQEGVRFVLDLHAAAASRRFGVALGTMCGESCPAYRADIVRILRQGGFREDARGLDRLDLDRRFTARGKRGQETITRYACQGLGIPAAQFELHPCLRIVERRPDASFERPFRGDPQQIERVVRVLVELVSWLARACAG
jgi:hypothetical protein